MCLSVVMHLFLEGEGHSKDLYKVLQKRERVQSKKSEDHSRVVAFVAES